MTMPSSTFHRGLSKSFLAALHDLTGSSTGQWWLDVLIHPDLKLAIRNEAIDVYHRGAAIFRIVPDGNGHVVARTHFKYLMRRRQAHAVLAADGKTFVYDPGETSLGHPMSQARRSMRWLPRLSALPAPKSPSCIH